VKNEQKQPNFYIKDIPVYGDLILAPMDGISVKPFRMLTQQLGAALNITGFISMQEYKYCPQVVEKKHIFDFDESERPIVFQIYDYDVERMIESAQRLMVWKPDIIDVNLGCPSKKVNRHGAGVGMMREPKKVEEIFKRLTKLLPVPVTGKIRIGWNDLQNYMEIARIIEDNGGAMLAMHGRTKEQMYGGKANWDTIAEVRQALSIPVIANGDVRKVEDIQRIKDHTGCEAVMIGRGAIDNPWIFSRRDREDISPTEVRGLIETHLNAMTVFFGDRTGMMLFRKHAVQYLKPYRTTKEIRSQLYTTEDPKAFLKLLDQYIFEKTS
jgi:nifR3 family TIM-barrel protein